MKKHLLPLVSLFLIVTSCEVTVGGNDSDSKEKSEIKNGFSYESFDVSINGIEPIKNNEIIRGENIILEFSGVQNATIKDDFQHVGISLTIYDSKGEVYDKYDDLLSKIEQQDPKIDYLEAFFTVPLDPNEETLTMEVVLFDKYGSVSYDFKENYTLVSKKAMGTKGVEFSSNLESVELSSQLFLEKRQFEKTPINIYKGEEILIYLNGVKGFIEEDGVINMNYIMKVLDNEKNEVFFQEDQLSGPIEGYETYPLYFSKVFSEFSPGKYTWNILVTDKKSDKFAEVSAKITIQ